MQPRATNNPWATLNGCPTKNWGIYRHIPDASGMPHHFGYLPDFQIAIANKIVAMLSNRSPIRNITRPAPERTVLARLINSADCCLIASCPIALDRTTPLHKRAKLDLSLINTTLTPKRQVSFLLYYVMSCEAQVNQELVV